MAYVRFTCGGLVAGLLSLGLLFASPMAAGAGMMKAPEDQVMAMSKYDFNETVSRVKQAIEGENMMVLRTIDMQEMLKMVGLETKGMQTILFFHPRYGKEIYTKARMAGIEPPLKLSVMENEMGKVMVRYRKPSAIFAPYKPLSDLGKELDEVVGRIVGKVGGMMNPCGG